jgi:hypothetical protein
MNEYTAAQRRIERSGNRDVIDASYDGFDIAVARCLCPGASDLDSTCFAIDSYNKTRRANGIRK